MKKINWQVRIKNRNFWLTFIPALLLLAQVIAIPFGYDFKIEPINSQLIAIINAAFAVLAIVGVVNDPTTAKVADSEQALSYTEPKKDEVAK